MRVCVVGCGAVGSLFAANLASLEDVEVWAYDLAQAHVEAINERGLRLTGAGEVHATGIRATADASAWWPRSRQGATGRRVTRATSSPSANGSVPSATTSWGS